MAIVTTGLQLYFNPKDGIKAGNKLNNLAPAGIAGRQANVLGGTIIANGALQMDGIDDSVNFDVTEPMWTVVSSPYTFEYVFTPRKFTTDMEVINGGIWMGTFSWGDLYWEFYNTTGGYLANQATVLAAMNSANVAYLQVVYTGTSYNVYMNGTLLQSNSMTNHAFGIDGHTNMKISSNADMNPLKADLHALRLYNRALSTAELTTNRGETIEIGLPITKTRTGILNFHPGVLIPVYDITGNTSEKLRFQTAEGLQFIEVVPTTDPNASKIRIRVAGVTMALKK